jgi:hypothetical protein
MAPVDLTDESLERALPLEAEDAAARSLDGMSPLERVRSRRASSERDYGDIARELGCSEVVVSG